MSSIRSSVRIELPLPEPCEQRRDQQQRDTELEQGVAHGGVQIGVFDGPEQEEPDQEGLHHDPSEDNARNDEMCDAEPMRHRRPPFTLGRHIAAARSIAPIGALAHGCLHP